MPQEKLKFPTLFAVPNSGQAAPEPEYDEAPETVGDEPVVCPKCYGSGMEVVPGRGARKCECRKQKTQTKLLDKARIPKRYDKCDFHNYIPNTQSQKQAVWMASQLGKEYHPNFDGKGILFMGSVGVGKTHLAVSILKILTERGFDCLFYEFGSLLKSIQDSYNTNTQSSELKVLSPILETEVLVLDELGASKPTEWVRDTMAHIINTRYNDKKLTIFTTNYLDERRTERDETLEDRIGVRLRSRLFEMCKTVPMSGEDFRKTFDKVSPIKKK